MPVYSVKNTAGYPRLVRAPNKAQALSHVAKSEFFASVATVDEVIDLMTGGVRVETAGDPDSVPAMQAEQEDVARLADKFYPDVQAAEDQS